MAICFGNKGCQERAAKRVDAKFETKQVRIENRTARVGDRENTKATAWQQGLDPNASKWGAISSMTASVAGAAASMAGGGGSVVSAGGGGGNGSVFSDSGVDASALPGGGGLLWLLLAAGAWFMLKK